MTRLLWVATLLSLAAGPAVAQSIYDSVNPGPFLKPIDMPGLDTVVVPFDLDPASGTMEDYTGWYGTQFEEWHALDGNAATLFVVPLETPVLASADGQVIDLNDGVPVGDPNAANYVWIEHDNAYESTYWDLSPGIADHVALDDVVSQGDTLALSNGVQDEVGPHLTFGTFLDGVAGCPMYWGYWKQGLDFFKGVYQYVGRPVYSEMDIGSEVVGHQEATQAYCGTAYNRDGFLRYWHPTDWGSVVQAMDRLDGLEHEADYDETGAWSAVEGGSRAEHVVGLATRGSDDASAQATFIPQLGTTTEYEVFATWGVAANAQDVVYTIGHQGGVDTATLTQNGGGLGTYDEPRVITGSSYADHGDTDLTGSFYLFNYSCAGSPEMAGPEVTYRIELSGSGTLSASVTHDDDVDVDVALFSELDEDACLAWHDSAIDTAVDAGTYYLLVDTPGADSTAAGGFDLQVTTTATPAGDSAGPEADPDQWHSLGTYSFVAGKGSSTITVSVPDDLAGVTGNPPRVAADAILLLNTGRLPFAWSEGGGGSEIADSILILKEHALLGIHSEASWPVQTEPFEDSEVLFRARRGQRFMSDINYDGWYEITMPGMAGERGYLHEECCFIHHRLLPTDIDDWYPTDDDDDSDPDDDDTGGGDDDGCECSVTESAPPVLTVTALIALAALGLLRRRP